VQSPRGLVLPVAFVGMTSPPFPVPAEPDLDRLLPPDVDLSGPGLRHEAARPVWLGIVWSRLGRADLAWQVWDRVGAPAVQSWLAAERGRVVREFGLHAEAERIEWRALASVEDPGDRAMLQVSLVADAVGRGDLDTMTRRLEAAREAVAGLPDGPRAARQRLRLGWVTMEVAMWTGGEVPVPAVDAPDLAYGSAFHRAKQALFAGIATGSLEVLDVALAEDVPVLTWAVHLARADLGEADAIDAARTAWAQLRFPPPYERAIRATPTAHRLQVM